jgi:small multidrug resistance family-3 protein
MSKLAAISMVFLAAAPGAGGDAFIPTAIRTPGWSVRLVFGFTGALVLLACGLSVNTPPWNFGRLLGLYVVFFFVISQAVCWLVFHEVPSASTLAGGALIIAGGAVIAMGTA